jgi:hypothetical protein
MISSALSPAARLPCTTATGIRVPWIQAWRWHTAGSMLIRSRHFHRPVLHAGRARIIARFYRRQSLPRAHQPEVDVVGDDRLETSAIHSRESF